MYPVSDWSSFSLRTIMDISARATSLAERPRRGPFGSPVFACAGKTDPPSRLILSQTSAGKGCWLDHRDCSVFWSVPLFVPRGRSFGFSLKQIFAQPTVKEQAVLLDNKGAHHARLPA